MVVWNDYKWLKQQVMSIFIIDTKLNTRLELQLMIFLATGLIDIKVKTSRRILCFTYYKANSNISCHVMKSNLSGLTQFVTSIVLSRTFSILSQPVFYKNENIFKMHLVITGNRNSKHIFDHFIKYNCKILILTDQHIDLVDYSIEFWIGSFEELKIMNWQSRPSWLIFILATFALL